MACHGEGGCHGEGVLWEGGCHGEGGLVTLSQLHLNN